MGRGGRRRQGARAGTCALVTDRCERVQSLEDGYNVACAIAPAQVLGGDGERTGGKPPPAAAAAAARCRSPSRRPCAASPTCPSRILTHAVASTHCSTSPNTTDLLTASPTYLPRPTLDSAHTIAFRKLLKYQGRRSFPPRPFPPLWAGPSAPPSVAAAAAASRHHDGAQAQARPGRRGSLAQAGLRRRGSSRGRGGRRRHQPVHGPPLLAAVLRDPGQAQG